MDPAPTPVRYRFAHEGEQVPPLGRHLPGHDLEQECIVGCIQCLSVAEGELELAVVVLGVDRFQLDAHLVGRLGALETEVQNLNANHIRIRFIGALDSFAAALQEGMQRAEQLTRDNTRLTLNIAVGYGGRWDMLQAVRNLAADAATGKIRTTDFEEVRSSNALALAPAPDPDLFIRTGGERRISNFLLWNLAYTELYFRSEERRVG